MPSNETALYTIITFPFLFAVMFGDCGHAIIMALFGLWMVLSEKKLATQKKNEIFSIFFGGRYIILLMGLFSFYTGFVYNDMFSKSLNIFGSSWMVKKEYLPKNFLDEHRSDTDIDFIPKNNYRGDPYYIGVDPAWQVATNKIIFLNSFKMKLSIIFGVVHMIFGVIVSTFNFFHFKNYVGLILEFIPQILLLIFLFLWMVVMMFLKWFMYTAEFDGQPEHCTTSSSCAPSVLIYFINMMLFNEAKPPEHQEENGFECICNLYMFEGQGTIQKVLVFAALICIPVLLLGKPLAIMMSRKKKPQQHKVSNGRSNGDINQGLELEEVPENKVGPAASAYKEEEEEEEPMSEIFIHQAIHTIEYVLSTISHTASYLRLWALSLAHAQLSEVLWNMLFQMGLKSDNYLGVVLVFIFFGAWAMGTIAILVVMEGLSAFLHTLRLHWVEFMSKFYAGEGYPFEPFSFKTILEQEEEQ